MPMPRKPVEIKRRNGNPGKRPLPKPSTVVALSMAVGVPSLPNGVSLRVGGSVLWANIWTAGAIWISPATDSTAVLEACRIADDLEMVRERYQATRDTADLKGALLASKALREALAALGFDPTARSRLGVAEVKAASKLEELRAKRTRREAGSA